MVNDLPPKAADRSRDKFAGEDIQAKVTISRMNTGSGTQALAAGLRQCGGQLSNGQQGKQT
jgi:hypothetical protein